MIDKNFVLSDKVIKAWSFFLANESNHGHAKRVLSGENIDAHVQACWRSAQTTVQRVIAELPDLAPKRILEIGSSAGLNCFALQQRFPNAEVIGIEPEQQAVAVATAMINSSSKPHPQFRQGLGEQLQLQDGSIDLIVCHTVIEHVNNVEAVVKEMARVLSQKGFVHLEAPNYRFPYEPHLKIYTVPLFGKGFVKLTALLQGKWRQRNFVNHLKFVTSGSLEKQFNKYGLSWHNRAIDKLQAAANGCGEIRKYRKIAKILNHLQRIGVAPLIIALISKLGIYPSVLYTLHKRTDA